MKNQPVLILRIISLVTPLSWPNLGIYSCYWIQRSHVVIMDQCWCVYRDQNCGHWLGWSRQTVINLKWKSSVNHYNLIWLHMQFSCRHKPQTCHSRVSVAGICVASNIFYIMNIFLLCMRFKSMNRSKEQVSLFADILQSLTWSCFLLQFFLTQSKECCWVNIKNLSLERKPNVFWN